MHFQKCLPSKFKASFPIKSPREYWLKHNKISEIKAPPNYSQTLRRWQNGWPDCMRGSRTGKAVEVGAFISALGIFRALRGKCKSSGAQRRHWWEDTSLLLMEP